MHSILFITSSLHYPIEFKNKFFNFTSIFLSPKEAEKKIATLPLSFLIIDDDGSAKTLLPICKAKKVPILVSTDSLQEEYLEELKQLGVTEFLDYPLNKKNIEETLLRLQKKRQQKELTQEIPIPTNASSTKNISDFEVLPKEIVKQIKDAFSQNKAVTLALVAATNFSCSELTINIGKNLYCVLSLTKNRKEMLDLIQESKEKIATGIVSSIKKPYTDISQMLCDAHAALNRAKENPYGYSF